MIKIIEYHGAIILLVKWKTQRLLDVFKDQTYSKPSKKNYITNKTIVYNTDHIWNFDIIILNDYDPKNIRSYEND